MLLSCARRYGVWLFVGVTFAACSLSAVAQEAAEPDAKLKLPEIADEPQLIDPATVIPAKLAAKATVEFKEAPITEVVEWLREKQKIPVLVDKRAIDGIGVFLTDPAVSDRLDDAPIYLLLNRLRSEGLAWTYQDDILHLTTPDVLKENLTMTPYNIGDLIDAGYEARRLEELIPAIIDPFEWEDVGGPGGLSMIGDVLFVSQTNEIQYKIQSLLAAIRKHSRRTFIFTPPQHLQIRAKMAENVSVDFDHTPLDQAVSELAEKLEIDFRIDLPALKSVGLRERLPVSLKLSDRKASTVVKALGMDFELSWMLRDGVLWLTTPDEGSESAKTAVFDVRDLCRNDHEAAALGEAVRSQTAPDEWDVVGGPASLAFAKSGAMVVTARDELLDDVLILLETYRTALVASKLRDRDKVDPKEIVTEYYRMHANVAEDLENVLPQLVESEHWKTIDRPDAKGRIVRIAASPEVVSPGGSEGDGEKTQSFVIPKAVLVITQSRSAHDEIVKVLRKIDSVHAGKVQDPPASDPFDGGGGMGGGFGGGGFGGGLFSLPFHQR